MAAGKFRKDLFYRLKVFTIRLPPLRERPDDIPGLVEHSLQLYRRELGKPVHAVAPEALRLLETYPWPGNVRELQSVIKYALVHAQSDVLTPDCLPENLRNWVVPIAPHPSEMEKLELGQLVRNLVRSGESDIYPKICMEMDRIVLGEVLRHVSGNQVRASEILGISRTTLRAKLRSLEQAEQHRPGTGQI